MISKILNRVLIKPIEFINRNVHIKRYKPKSKRYEKMPLHGYLTALLPAGAFLGSCYSLANRTEWENFRKEMGERSLEEPVPLPKNVDDIEMMEYQRVRVTGKFDHSRELYIGPKNLKTGFEYLNESWGEKISVWDGQPDLAKFNKTLTNGYWVVTPFVLSDKSGTVLVNRGWVTSSGLKPENRLEGQIDKEVELVGYIRHTEKEWNFFLRRNFIARANDPDSNQWQLRDVPAIAKKLNTLPIFIDCDRNSSTPGGPIGGQTTVLHPDHHNLYIYGLLLVALALYFFWHNKYIEAYMFGFYYR